MTARNEILHAIDRLAAAGRERDLARIDKRHRDARALVTLHVPTAHTQPDFIDRCWQCDTETRHSRLSEDGRCATCAGADPT